MKYLATIFLLSLINFAISQEFSAIILDADDQPEMGAQVLNITNQKNTVSKKDGLFIIEASPGDSLKISPIKKDPFFYVVPNFLSSDYEIYFINSEDEKIQQIQGVTITSNKIKPVVERFNANVIDYIPFKNGRLLTVCSLRNKFKLYIEANDEVIEEFEVDIKNIEELFIDIFGNYHLVCKDSTYQIVLSEELIQLDVIPTDVFNDNIRNIVYNDHESIVSSIFSNHNKAFRLIKSSSKDGRKKIIHTIVDIEALKQANKFYNLIITTYMNTVREEYNIISNGIWTGDLTHLIDGQKIREMVIWYNTVESKKINVHTFPFKDSILIIDFDNLHIKLLGKNGETYKQTAINNPFTKKKFTVLLDPITDNYFCYDPNDAIIEMYQIDLNSGELSPCLTLDGVAYPKKLKVFNGWLYFIDLNNASFNKLYRAKLDN